ncbi:MAG: threonine--tRNA ligase [Anaerolineales bacterium]|nr:threonine--tRNA ligase [Anaerolineales bacterium]
MAKQAEEKYQESQLYKIRHSAAHIMAQAVLERFPEAKYTIGPPIENGFYYDFELPEPISQDDLPQLEKRMRQIIAGQYDFVKEVLPAEKTREIFKDQPYKLELIDGLEKGGFDEYGEPLDEKPEISIYKSDSFVDLCRGPHVDNTKQINPAAVKLMSITGAYWRGDENNKMLTRIYGTAWETTQELEEYLHMLEEAKKRDHRNLGRELDLFSISEDVGPGLILWHPNGGIVRKKIEDFWGEEHERGGYDFVYTPHIGKSALWQTSGHLDFYKENMYSAIEIEDQNYYLKPMNCPFHMQIFRSRIRSYRDLPLRFAERGTVYRYERSGVLHGLLRVRGFTQDDAHHFCRPDQMDDELSFVLDFCMNILRAFGLTEFSAYLSTKPEKSVGSEEQWEFAEKSLEKVLIKANLPFKIDEGGGAFYGPKIDLVIKDALGREWQISTIQFDFNMPERFDLSYVGEDGKNYQPYMLHRALLGSMERFFGLIVEHFSGAFPVWLAPQQIVVLPIADRHVGYGEKVTQVLKSQNLRVDLDASSERISKKIRNAQQRKTPYMLVIGDREVESNTVSVRLRSEEDLGTMELPVFIQRVQKAIDEKRELY